MQQPPDWAIVIAKTMLKRRKVKPHPPATGSDVVRALTFIIAATPARSPYGQALIRVFRDYHPYEGVERYILHALHNGHPAYEYAVAQHVQRHRERVKHVAQVVDDTGEGPTWAELGKAMGWAPVPKSTTPSGC